MEFIHAQHAAGNTTTKIALVVVFHVLFGMALVRPETAMTAQARGTVSTAPESGDAQAPAAFQWTLE